MNDISLKEKKADRLILLSLLFLGVFLTFLVSPFSPIYRYCFEPDEICYHIMSRGLLSGKVPYRDLFDHKGPLTYLIYALGLLLSGKATWGIWILFTFVNIGIFALLYKNLRVFLSWQRSLVGTAIMLALLFLKCEPIYASGSKPDHFILLLLLLSEYLLLLRLKGRDEEKKEHKFFSTLDMFFMGLLCGGVFMLKLNVCIYYLLFIGSYFLFLLIKKMGKAFFSSCGAFLGGIAAVSLPFFIYFAANGVLSDFIDAYFLFNSKYAKNGGLKLHFERSWIDPENQITIVILFLLLVIGGLIFLSSQKQKKQRLICVALGAVTYFSMSLPEVFAYSFVLIVPLYILAIGYVADVLVALLSEKVAIGASLAVLLFALSNFTIFQVFLTPPIEKEKPAFEAAMETYYDAHPDATCLFFTNLCDSFFYDLGTESPDYKYFYMPREATLDIYNEQVSYIRQKLPSVIALYCSPSADEELMTKIQIFIMENDYELYFDDHENSRYYAFVRKE